MTSDVTGTTESSGTIQPALYQEPPPELVRLTMITMLMATNRADDCCEYFSLEDCVVFCSLKAHFIG